LSLFARSGSSGYGFTLQSEFGPSTLEQAFYGNVTSPDGWYVSQAGGEGSYANTTYYAGPVTWQHPYGTGEVDPSINYTISKEPTWIGWSDILGAYGMPLMTRYLYAVNMSKVPDLMTGSTVCPEFPMMFSLSSPANTPVGGNWLELVDNFPSHSPMGPLQLASYLHVYVRFQNQMQVAKLVNHSVVILDNQEVTEDHNYAGDGNPTHTIFTYDVANFTAAQPGYVFINGTAGPSLWWVGVVYRAPQYSAADFSGLFKTGLAFAIPAGNVSIAVQVLGVSGTQSANITAVYVYQTFS
jgi:hypothetical protein